MSSNISSISFLTSELYSYYFRMQPDSTYVLPRWYTPIQVVIHSQPSDKDLWYGAKAPMIDNEKSEYA
jgi:hypothetical protein